MDDKASEIDAQPDLQREKPERPTVADHGGAIRPGDPLDYPYGEKVPDGADIIELHHDVKWARVPLPWSLDHINVYLLRDEGGWALVDTGSRGDRGTELWDAIFDGPLKGERLTRVIATHLHPDHLGLAGWLCERFDVPLYMTQGEFLLANRLWAGASEDVPQAEIDFLIKAGMDPQYGDAVRSVGFGTYKKGVHKLPHSYHRLEDGSVLTIGGNQWRIMIGRGHSPEHACLYCEDLDMFIGGDQVLPQITSNVSVYAGEPSGNPLAHWLTSLDRMAHLDADPLVLPAHGPVFRGYHDRLKTLIAGHIRRMGKLHESCKEKPRSGVSSFRALYNRKITGFDFFMALGEALAHLHALESIGLLKRIEEDGVFKFSAIRSFDADGILPALMALPGVALRPLASVGFRDKAA